MTTQSTASMEVGSRELVAFLSIFVGSVDSVALFALQFSRISGS